MGFAYLVATYGYFAVFLGSIFEGETVLILGGLASHEGYLNLAIVFLVAFLGAVVGDLLLFLLGKYKGQKIIDSYPKIKKRMTRPQFLIEKHKILIALGMRFMYGFRLVIPFTLGMSSISIWTFTVWNVSSAVVWTLSVGTAGYFFGNFLETFLGKLRHYELRVIFFTVLFLGIGYGVHKLIRFMLYKIDKDDILEKAS